MSTDRSKSVVGTLIGKAFIILFILCAIGFLYLYHSGRLYWGASNINLDNTLSDRITLSSVPFVVGGLLLGIALCCSRSRKLSMWKRGRTLFRLLSVMACVLLVMAILWDISLVRFINGTLATRFPERLQQGRTSYVEVLLSGILLFGLCFVVVGIAGGGNIRTFLTKAKTRPSH